MNLYQLFSLSLKGRANKEALQFQDQTFTFGQLDQRSQQMALFLQQNGLVQGDRLGVYLENGVELIDLFLACVQSGIIFVPMNIMYRERELTHIIEDAAPKLLISDGPVPGGFDSLLKSELAAVYETAFAPFIPAVISGDDPAALVYTSGTTGKSKGAVLTHNNFLSNGVNLCSSWNITEADRFLLALPLFHVHALANGIHSWLISGCHMHLLPRFEYQKAEAQFETYQPTLFFGVPTMYIRLLDWDAKIAQKVGATARLFVCGSAPLPPQVLTDFEAKFGHVILERYGMTETLMNLSNPYMGERRAGTVGFTLPGISAKIMQPDGMVAPIGQEGEVYIKGPNVCAGYWNRPDATEEAFVDGYFKTGDMGECAADGYITLKGRKSDLIISGGFNIYPREIEEYLSEQAGVLEVVVVGVPHESRGEVPVAYLVTDQQYDDEAVQQNCVKTFASFKIPRTYIQVNSLPRTALGKVQKHLLPKP